jgi:DNA-binding transcriptional ArsR family regulator
MARAKLELFDDSLVRLAGFAKALAHPARLRILRQLSGTRETGCMELVDRLPLSQPACSRHVAELLRVGLLKSRESGNRVFLRINTAALEQFCRSMHATLLHRPKPQKTQAAAAARPRRNTSPRSA